MTTLAPVRGAQSAFAALPAPIGEVVATAPSDSIACTSASPSVTYTVAPRATAPATFGNRYNVAVPLVLPDCLNRLEGLRWTTRPSSYL